MVIFDGLNNRLALGQHGGRTTPGVYSRIAACFRALAAGIWHN